MRRFALLFSIALFCLFRGAAAQRPDSIGPAVRKVLRVSTPRVILEHVNVIDGTGASPSADRNITIESGKITSITAGADVPASDGTTILDLRGHSVIPGIVGMHDHFWFSVRPNLAADNSSDAPGLLLEMAFSAPRLYLANGVTTLRTAGSVEPYTDVKLKRAIEAGLLPGPHLDVTGPYLDGTGNTTIAMPVLANAEDARATVAFWADHGVTSFKAYANITRAELGAAIAEAHKHGIKVTGHLCSVTYEEAVSLGIDNLEHGFMANTALDPGKQPDVCSGSAGDSTLAQLTPGGAEANRLIALLVAHHVAITSTLVLRATSVARNASTDGGPMPRPGALDAMSPYMREAYQLWRSQPRPVQGNGAMLLRQEMALEHAFAAAGGLLIAGPDPVGIAGMVPGFSDHREIELLVEAGFTPLEAIKIATLNGATYLGRADRIGSIAVGKNADLVVIKGDPSARIADIENVEIVFKDGLGYDRAKLLASVKGRYGEY
jgi:imidazolonepropionase-like amidohydrolase